MTLHRELTDASISIARRAKQKRVEPVHVLLALLQHPRLGAHLGGRTIPPQQLLGPPGAASVPPTVSPEASRLLGRCRTESGAVRVLFALLEEHLPEEGSGPPEPGSSSATSRRDAEPPADRPGPRDRSAPQIPAPVRPAEREALREKAERELDQLVGLASVKDELRKLIALQQVNVQRRRDGLPELGGSLHLILSGNPGTGKTTVARILADFYAGLGLLSKGHLMETDRSGLVGEYVGHTAVKVREVVEQALGGVLLIDEAYALASEQGQNDFGREAIDTLVKLMEDHRDDLAVFVAGYASEMPKLLAMNPGLPSRLGRTIDFPDYSVDELREIFLLLAEASHITLPAATLVRLDEVLGAASLELRASNGRFVRNLFEEACGVMAVRAISEGVAADHLAPEDLPEPPATPPARRIGFHL